MRETVRQGSRRGPKANDRRRGFYRLFRKLAIRYALKDEGHAGMEHLVIKALRAGRADDVGEVHAQAQTLAGGHPQPYAYAGAVVAERIAGQGVDPVSGPKVVKREQ